MEEVLVKQVKALKNSVTFWRRVKKLRSILTSLKSGVSIAQACKGAKVDVSSLWAWRKINPALDALMYDVIDSRVMLVEDAMFREAVNGNVTAGMYFLNNRVPTRWQDKRQTTFNNTNEANTYNVANPLAKAKDTELDDIIDSRNRYAGVVDPQPADQQ